MKRCYFFFKSKTRNKSFKTLRGSVSLILSSINFRLYCVQLFSVYLMILVIIGRNNDLNTSSNTSSFKTYVSNKYTHCLREDSWKLLRSLLTILTLGSQLLKYVKKSPEKTLNKMCLRLVEGPNWDVILSGVRIILATT